MDTHAMMDSRLTELVPLLDDLLHSEQTDLQTGVTVMIRSLHAELMERRKKLLDFRIHVVQPTQTQRERKTEKDPCGKGT